MRYSEIIKEGDPQGDPSILLTTLSLLRQHAYENGTTPVIPTDAVLELVKNSGYDTNYNAFVNAYKKHKKAFGQLIKSFNRDTITFSSVDGEDEFSLDPNSPDVDLGTDTVARMAHSALNKRK